MEIKEMLGNGELGRKRSKNSKASLQKSDE